MDAKEIKRRIESNEPLERKKKFPKVGIGLLIGVVISLVVGISSLPGIMGAGKEAGEKGGAPEELAIILSIVFVAIIILGAVAWIGFGGRDEKYEEVGELSEADKIRELQRKKRRHLVYEG